MSVIRKFIRNFGVVAAFTLASVFLINAQSDNKTSSSKSQNYIETVAKVLSIDPVKGDVGVRLEFAPYGNLMKEDGSLARTVKFDVNSSNGKQEITFEKGKKMPPAEVVLNMYDGEVSNYPFDQHKAALVFWFTVKPDKPADKPKPTEEAPAETKPTETVEETEEEVPFTLDFAPALSGYRIETAKSKDSDETYVDIEMTIARSGMVKFFSVFVMLLMWGVSLAVFLLALSVVVRGRKVEIAMFSFIATLIFSFVAVRNAQPGVPSVGTLSDYLAFFGAEVVLALSLLAILFTWIIRPQMK